MNNFNINNLVVCDKSVTHTHTHTHSLNPACALFYANYLLSTNFLEKNFKAALGQIKNIQQSVFNHRLRALFLFPYFFQQQTFPGIIAKLHSLSVFICLSVTCVIGQGVYAISRGFFTQNETQISLIKTITIKNYRL